MSLRAFRGGNPHERLVAISDTNLLGACRPTLCMIMDDIILKQLSRISKVVQKRSSRKLAGLVPGSVQLTFAIQDARNAGER